MEVIAQLKNLRMSPKKVRLVSDSIKGLKAGDALTRLQFTHKAPAPVIAKLLKSALANAQHNQNLSADVLEVRHVVVNEALALKRWKPAAFGAAHPFKRRGSHIRLTLGVIPGTQLPAERTSLKAREKSKDIPTVQKAGARDISRAPAQHRRTQVTEDSAQSVSRRDGRRGDQRSITRTTSK